MSAVGPAGNPYSRNEHVTSSGSEAVRDQREFVACRSLGNGRIYFIRKEFIRPNSDGSLTLRVMGISEAELFEDTGYSGKGVAVLNGVTESGLLKVKVSLNGVISKHKLQRLANCTILDTNYILEKNENLEVSPEAQFALIRIQDEEAVPSSASRTPAVGPAAAPARAPNSSELKALSIPPLKLNQNNQVL